MKRPRARRPRASDRLTSPDNASKPISAIDHMVATLDRTARDYDDKWGIDQLPNLVSAETARIWGNTIASLNAAIQENDPDKTKKAIDACLRGFAYMDAEAEKNGAPKISGKYIEVDCDDFGAAIIQDVKDTPEVKRLRPDLEVWTYREVAIAIKAYSATYGTGQVKSALPEAQVTKLPPLAYDKELDDEIPGF